MTESTEAAATRRRTDSKSRGEGNEADARARPAATRRAVLRVTAGIVSLSGPTGLVSSARARKITDERRDTDQPGTRADENRRDTRDVMFTCNAKDGSVSLIDARSFESLGTIDVYPDENPEDQVSDVIDHVEPQILNAFARENYIEHVNISPDGRTMYAARGHAGDVVAVDIETEEKVWEAELYGYRADHQTISPDGSHLFTSDLTVDRVEKIDAETGKIVGGGVVRDLPHGDHYHHLPAFDDRPVLVNGSLGNMVYPDSRTGDHWAHQLTFIAPDTMTTLRTFEFEEGVRPFAITADGRKAYVQISYFHGFHEYDIDANEITRTKEMPQTEHVPATESDYPLQSAHHGIDISGDGEFICVAGTTAWYAGIVRRSDFELVGTVPVGEHPYWVRTGPSGDHAFVAVREPGEVAVIDYETAEEIARIQVGRQPHVTEYSAVPAEIL